jgi:hypothetical protein
MEALTRARRGAVSTQDALLVGLRVRWGRGRGGDAAVDVRAAALPPLSSATRHDAVRFE